MISLYINNKIDFWRNLFCYRLYNFEIIFQKLQFNIQSFNGVKVGEKGLKYKEVQGDLYKYAETVLISNGFYLFLTSDSPRSYMMNVRHISIDGLFAPKEKQSYKINTSIEAINVDYIKQNRTSFYLLFGNVVAQRKGVSLSDVRKLDNVIFLKHFILNDLDIGVSINKKDANVSDDGGASGAVDIWKIS